MDRDRNKKYSLTQPTARRSMYISPDIKRRNYLNNSNKQTLARSAVAKPATKLVNQNKNKNTVKRSKKNNPGNLSHYSDFPLPSRRKLQLPKLKLNFTYRRIMLALGILLLLTLSANLVLFYNYQKNHPAEAKIVLNEDTGKGIEIDDYSGYDKTPITPSVINSHKTENDIPKYLQIQKINLNSRIKIVSSDSSGSIKVPKNIYDVGWYEGSAKPGDRGVVFLDGTSVLDRTQGIFANIARLDPGDSLSIIMGDGLEYKYTVKKTKIIDSKNFNILSSIDPPEIKGQGLSITVNYGPENDSFKQRFILLAEKQQ